MIELYRELLQQKNLDIAMVPLNFNFTVTCVATHGNTTWVVCYVFVWTMFPIVCNIHALCYSLCVACVICVEQPHKSH